MINFYPYLLKMVIKKRGEILNQAVIQLILIGLIFALFIFATAGKVDSRGMKQQVLERQIALLIDSAVPGMSFEIAREHFDGTIQSIEIRDRKVFVGVAGLASFEGYPYFSRYSVKVVGEEDKFVVSVYE